MEESIDMDYIIGANRNRHSPPVSGSSPSASSTSSISSSSVRSLNNDTSAMLHHQSIDLESNRRGTVDDPSEEDHLYSGSRSGSGSGLIASRHSEADHSFSPRAYLQNPVLNNLFNRTIYVLKKTFILGPKMPSDPIYQCNHTLLLAKLDLIPFRVRKKLSFSLRIIMLVLYLILWFSMIFSIIKKNLYGAPQLITQNSPINANNTDIIQLSCREHADFWRGKNAFCGLNAQYCLRDFRLFNNDDNNSKDGNKDPDVPKKPKDANAITSILDKDVIIKCPALCDSESRIYSTVTTGLYTYKYISYVVGGGRISSNDHYDNLVDKDQITYPYRADSFPCAAALHAGLISPTYGGTARMSFISSNDRSITRFGSTVGEHIGKSIEFNSTFPYSFIFKKLSHEKDSQEEDQEVVRVTNSYDYRMYITGINILLGVPVMYFYEGAINYVIISIVAYWNIILALDPPVILDSLNPRASSYLISVGFRRFLPLAFTLYALWQFVVRRTLNKNASPLGKIIFWYPLFWISIMNNLTFDRYLSVDRLLISDIKKQIGLITSVLIVGALVAVCVVVQAYAIWRAGKLIRYLKFYFLVFTGMVLLNYLPGLTLRIHHYIFGLILIPGTSTRGFSALLFQGLLLGFIINGVARWDFASIVETDGSLRRDDPFEREDLRPPTFSPYDSLHRAVSWSSSDSPSADSFIESASQSLSDNIDARSEDYDDVNSQKLTGYSLIINDIERYRGFNSTIYLDSLMASNLDFGNFLQRTIASMDVQEDIDLYLRVAKASVAHEKVVGDYTNAAVLKWPSGEFTIPKPGVT